MSSHQLYDEQVPLGICPHGLRQLCGHGDVSIVNVKTTGVRARRRSKAQAPFCPCQAMWQNCLPGRPRADIVTSGLAMSRIP